MKVWAAVIRRAVVDSVLYNEHKDEKLQKVGKDAADWLSSEDTADGSFEAVCCLLGLDSGALRGLISRMSESDVRHLRGMNYGEE